MEKKDGYLYAHEATVNAVKHGMPEAKALYELADLYKVFADTTRLKILYALLQAEMCVGDLALLFGMGQSAVSHQLRVLKDKKLIKCRRSGKSILYSPADDHVRSILDEGIEHISEQDVDKKEEMKISV